MYSHVRSYFNELFDSVGQSWNRFWFTPADPLPLSVIRVLTGMIATFYLLSFSPDLSRFLGREGMLPNDLVAMIESMRDADYGGAYRFSLFDLARDMQTVRLIHWASIAVLVLYTLGIFSRVTSVLAFVAMLSYGHRMFVIVSPFEMVLNFLMLYVCVGPSGACLSFDAWWRGRRKTGAAVAPSMAANISLRLIQVHLTAVFVMMLLAKMFGDAWWNGTAFWWLTQNSRGGVIDLTSLTADANSAVGRYIINLWTHAQVAYELLFPVMIWRATFRPLWLGLGLLIWTLLALASGLFAFGAVMIVATLSFMSADGWRAICGCQAKSPAAG